MKYLRIPDFHGNNFRIKLKAYQSPTTNKTWFQEIKKPNGEYNFELVPEFLGNDKRVKDVCRFSATRKGNSVNVNKLDDHQIKEKKHKRIVLLLESPHKDEYDADFNPIRPANGATGDELSKHFESVLHKLMDIGLSFEENEVYDVILMNPVPFQASLAYIFDGVLHSNIRNQMWKELFNILQQDFEKRLREYDADIVLNFCTYQAKKRLQQFLNSIFSGSKIQFFKGTHPSSWCFAVNLNRFYKA